MSISYDKKHRARNNHYPTARRLHFDPQPCLTRNISYNDILHHPSPPLDLTFWREFLCDRLNQFQFIRFPFRLTGGLCNRRNRFAAVKTVMETKTLQNCRADQLELCYIHQKTSLETSSANRNADEFAFSFRNDSTASAGGKTS